MKFTAALSKVLVVVVSLLFALPVVAATSTPTKKKGSNVSPKPTPAPTPTPIPTPTPDPDAIVIPGTVLPRKNGGFVSLTLEGGNFKLMFYDVKKQAIPAEAPKASARWNPKAKFGDDRTILLPTPDNAALKGSRFVKPPFPIIVYITLLNDQGTGTESFIFNFRPAAPTTKP